MQKSKVICTLCAILVTSITESANASLTGILPATPGGTDWQAYYDDEANLTYLANANAAGAPMNWEDAKAWAAGLVINGVTGWRLPETPEIGRRCATYNCTSSELGNLFYNVLGGEADRTITTTHNSNYDLFSNVQPAIYWSSTEYGGVYAWGFNFYNGDQNGRNKDINIGNYAWAVHLGNASVPQITIDIRPGNPLAPIILSVESEVWVAVLSDKGVDFPFDPASQIDIPEARFGPQEAKPQRSAVKDINQDGLGDLLLKFSIPETGIETTTLATLTVKTFDGQEFSGTDTIQIAKPVVIACDPKYGCNP